MISIEPIYLPKLNPFGLLTTWAHILGFLLFSWLANNKMKEGTK